MYKFLLINDNVAVSRLVDVSFKKLEYAFMEISDYKDLVLTQYVAIIIDSNMYDEGYIDDLKSLSILPSLIYLKKHNEDIPLNFNYSLEKPFLPTDFISFISGILENNKDVENQIAPFDKNNEAEIKKAVKSSNILKTHNYSELDNMDENRVQSAFERVDEATNQTNKQNTYEEKQFLTKSLDNLEEKEIEQVLEKKSLLPKPIPVEVVKGELQNAINQSISVAMQSQILKEALKGLKLNITITFEDNK